MKTIKKGTAYKRVSDTTADSMVKVQGWSYTSKSEWKTNVRDFNKTVAKNTVSDTNMPGTIESKPLKKNKKNGK
jgi:hypothetical protein